MPYPTSEQIINLKERQGSFRIRAGIISEIKHIQTNWANDSKHLDAFKDFIPMRLVTLIEVFLRGVVSELVEFGTPYSERAERLVKGTKIDFLLALNIQGQKISLADVVSYSISLNNVRQIISTMETLLPDFVEALKVSHPRWTEEKTNWPLKPIVDNFDGMLGILSRLFEVRHIVTHETPHDAPYSAAELNGFFSATTKFIEATDWCIVEKLEGAVPYTQLAMNIEAGEKLKKIQGELDEIVKKVTANCGETRSLFNDSQQLWAEYADSEATWAASIVKGGSMYPLVWASAKAEIVSRRLDDLRDHLERGEGEL